MTISQVANLMSLPIATICLFISLRAFYIYNLSRSDMIYVLGISMALISIGTFIGFAGDAHIAGNSLNTDWARSFGACGGALFIFLSSLMKSHKQMQQLKRWQVATAVLFVIVALLTPFYPPTKSAPIALSLNAGRMIIYTCAFIRYFALYLSKHTRFSLLMWIAFLVVVIGYGLNIPGILQSSLALVTIIAASVRITAYLTMLTAYSIG
jgi:hypothetical protein